MMYDEKGNKMILGPMWILKKKISFAYCALK